MKYLILLLLISCGYKSPVGCEESTEQVKADVSCNEEEEFCTMFEVKTKKCKEIDLSPIEEAVKWDK